LRKRLLVAGLVVAAGAGGVSAVEPRGDGPARAIAAELVAVKVPQRLSRLTLASSRVHGGYKVRATVAFTQQAPKKGLTVRVSAPGLTAPRTVKVLRGKSSASFWVKTGAVKASKTRTVKVTWGKNSRSRRLTVLPLPGLIGLTLATAKVTAGGSVVATVRLGGAAQPGGSVVILHSSSGDVTVPSKVTVPAGARTASFQAASRSGAKVQKVTLTAARGQARRDATLEVAAMPSAPSNPGPSDPGPSSPPSVPAPKVSGLLVAPASIKTGETATGKVTLDRKAEGSGVQVALTAPSGAAYVKFPASVTVPAGQAEASFQITGEAPAADPVRTTATLAAAAGAASARADLVVVPPFALRSVSVPAKIYERDWRLVAKVTANAPAPADIETAFEIVEADGSFYNEPAMFPGTIAAGATEGTINFVAPDRVTTPRKLRFRVTYAGKTVTTESTVYPTLATVTSEPPGGTATAPGPWVATKVIKFAVTVPEPADADYPIEINSDARCGCADVSGLFANPPVLKAGQKKVEFEIPVTGYNGSFTLTVTIAHTDHDLVWVGAGHVGP
jgi:hypothetical protein